MIQESRYPPFPELLQSGTPTCHDFSWRHSPLDLLSKGRPPGQTIEVCRYPSELLPVSRSDDTQQMDCGGGGIVRGAIGYLQPAPGQGGVGILGVSRRSRRKANPMKSDPWKSGCPNCPQDAGRVQPGSPDLLEWSIRSPSGRQVGALEEAGARVVKQTFQ